MVVGHAAPYLIISQSVVRRVCAGQNPGAGMRLGEPVMVPPWSSSAVSDQGQPDRGTGVASVIHRSSNQDGQHAANVRIALHSKGSAFLNRLL